MVIRAHSDDEEEAIQESENIKGNPKIYLRRWCAGPAQMCFEYQFLEINFFINIIIENNSIFRIAAYGKPAQIIEPLKAMLYSNRYIREQTISNYSSMLNYLSAIEGLHKSHRWFFLSDRN